jgi:hypothetical protein
MKFFFDENLGKQLSDGFKCFGEDTCHLLDYYDPGTKDEIWLEEIGKKGWILITKDRRIRRRPLEIEALKTNNVGAFFLSGKSMGKWESIKQLVQSWEKIQEIAKNNPRPFAFQINRSGTKVEKLTLA